MTRLHEIVLQYNVLYCGWKGVQEAKLYRNTKWYCDRKARQLGKCWARRRGRWGVGAAGKRQLGVGADGRASERARAAGKLQLGASAGAWQRRAGRTAGLAAGLATGCALGVRGLFSIRIDSVLFQSRFLDIVREPGS